MQKNLLFRGNTMTGKEIIMHYLDRHQHFTIPDLTQEYGHSSRLIYGAASAMIRRGELSRVKKEDGSVTYYPASGLNFSSESNDIFERCRNSPAMIRVLVVWGELPPAVLESGRR